MHRRHFIQTATLAGAGAALGSHALAGTAAPRFPLGNRETVVFLGDSITQQRLYTTHLECYWLTRYPTRRFTFRNSGWGGCTAWLRQRTQGTDMSDAKLFALSGDAQTAELVRMVTHGLNRDVLAWKPTVVTVDFGMNDGRKGEAGLPVYRRSLQEIVRQLKAANVRVALCNASPEERNQEGQPAGSAYNHMLEKYSAVVKEVAMETGVPFADQFHPYIEVVDAARKTNPGFRTMPDGVHPYPSGHLLMAWAILKGLGADSMVSTATVEAGRQNTRALRASITEHAEKNGVIAFTREDTALPWPLPQGMNGADVVLPHAPIVNDLSRYLLTVTGLKDGRYDVVIDGAKCATVSSADLASGWNLTTADTPMTQQAQALMAKVIEKNNVFFNRWRQVQVPAIVAGKADDPDTKSKLDLLDQQIVALEAEIEQLRKPKPHRFEIRPAA